MDIVSISIVVLVAVLVLLAVVGHESKQQGNPASDGLWHYIAKSPSGRWYKVNSTVKVHRNQRGSVNIRNTEWVDIMGPYKNDLWSIDAVRKMNAEEEYHRKNDAYYGG